METSCPACGNVNEGGMGMLGNCLHIRCRDCGFIYSIEVDPQDDEDEDRDG